MSSPAFTLTLSRPGGHVSKISVDTSVISSGVQKYFAPVSWMETLNNSVPTLAEAESALESLFDTPAEVCRTLAVVSSLRVQLRFRSSDDRYITGS